MFKSLAIVSVAVFPARGAKQPSKVNRIVNIIHLLAMGNPCVLQYFSIRNRDFPLHPSTRPSHPVQVTWLSPLPQDGTSWAKSYPETTRTT